MKTETVKFKAVVESLYKDGPPKPGELSAKKVVHQRSRREYLVAIDSQDHLHFLCQVNLERLPTYLSGFKLKKLTCSLENRTVESQESKFIVLTCESKIDDGFREPFYSLCENIFEASVAKNDDQIDSIIAILKKWKKFWTVDGPRAISSEWVKGLLGELHFLTALVAKRGEESITIWDGPHRAEHDFRANGIAVETKATTTTPPVVRINSLDQLDRSRLKELFLAIILLQKDEGGQSIVDLSDKIESQIASDQLKEEFWEKLFEAGFRRHHSHLYEAHRYQVLDTEIYEVDESFPRLTKELLKKPIDGRIHGVTYLLEVTNLQRHSIDSRTVIKAFSKLVP